MIADRFILFIFIFIFLICRKAKEALIHRARNYPDLLATCLRRYENIVVRLKINLELLAETKCRKVSLKRSAVKCLYQGHHKMPQVGFAPRPCRSQPLSNIILILKTSQDCEVDETAFRKDTTE